MPGCRSGFRPPAADLLLPWKWLSATLPPHFSRPNSFRMVLMHRDRNDSAPADELLRASAHGRSAPAGLRPSPGTCAGFAACWRLHVWCWWPAAMPGSRRRTIRRSFHRSAASPAAAESAGDLEHGPRLRLGQVVDVVDDYFRVEHEDRVRLVGDLLTEGRLDTYPRNASTIFEPWNTDSVTPYERWQATLQSMRRRAVVCDSRLRMVSRRRAGLQRTGRRQPPGSGAVSLANAQTLRNDDALKRLTNPVGGEEPHARLDRNGPRYGSGASDPGRHSGPHRWQIVPARSSVIPVPCCPIDAGDAGRSPSRCRRYHRNR